jgi:topoisomerase-4 subunit A
MSDTHPPHEIQDETRDNPIISLDGMYESYFLDYASYVILERAVPALEDGLKPVQRRILHAMKTMDDGRFHKVANIIGQTMQYHPHGDAAIGEALVNLGQKDLLIDCQGNWGDTRTGDSAAAPRYIEARLSKLALEILFNPQTTHWQLSYDGRKEEPITLPVKFPLVLAQGVEGIAVGLATKILPHNFNELLLASIDLLQGRTPVIYPDFQNGGAMDATAYNDGLRGGKLRVRAKIETVDKTTLAVRELPFGVTTDALINSIIKANDKGKIKIKKIHNNTAANVEILIELPAGVSPDVTTDALYSFTDCEISISPNACIIIADKPHFIGVSEILRICTDNTRELLRQELTIKQRELEEEWLFASLEKIFIEKRIYRKIEECETWEAVIATIDTELKRYIGTPSYPNKRAEVQLFRDVTTDDITKLTEIRIKRISKFNAFKADELMKNIVAEIEQTKHHLANLTEYTINWYQHLYDKYHKNRQRRTIITTFDTIAATQVAANNAKLYVNRDEGFIGSGMKKDEFVCDCSDIDDIIVFRKDGKFLVTRIADKTFVGKNIIHVAVWRKNDERTTYNMVYLDGESGITYGKRFNVKAITRDREYELTKGTKGSKIFYFAVHPNGEAETLAVTLTQSSTARIKNFEFDFGNVGIKGRESQGNIVTKYPVHKVVQKGVGKSTLGAQQIYVDLVSGRLNIEGRGQLLGAFDTGDKILTLYKNGNYELTDFELTNRYAVDDLLTIEKFDVSTVVAAIYFDSSKKASFVKRFRVETSTAHQKFLFIPEGATLLYATTKPKAHISYNVSTKRYTRPEELHIEGFIDVKGWKAIGNKLGDFKPIEITEIQLPEPDVTEQTMPEKLDIGAEIDLDVKTIKGGKQASIFDLDEE